MKKIVLFIRDKHLIFSILSLALCIYFVVSSIASYFSNNYIFLEDFTNNSGDNYNSFELLIPFYANLFAFGPLKSDPGYFNSNNTLFLFTVLYLLVVVCLELFGFKKRSFADKIVAFLSIFAFLIFECLFLIGKGHLEAIIYLVVRMVLLLLYLVYFFGNMFFAIKNTSLLERRGYLIRDIKITVIAVLAVCLLFLSGFASIFGFFARYYNSFHHPDLNNLYGFSQKFKELIEMSLLDRFPSFALFALSSLFLGLLGLIIGVIVDNKVCVDYYRHQNNDSENLSQ